MSAGEKLKALDAAMPPNLHVEVYPDNPLIALRDALPQIVAVVEAAEPFAAVKNFGWSMDEVNAVRDALAALDEALS